MLIVLILVLLIPPVIHAWEMTFGGEEYDRGFSIIQSTDGNLVIVGETESYGNGNNDVYLIKTTRSGEIIWEKTFGYTNGEVGFAVSECANGDLIIAGTTSSFGPYYNDIYLVRTTQEGNLIWEQAIGGDDEEVAYDLFESSDGGIIVAGRRGFSESALCLMKTDENGSILWQKTWPGGVARSVIETDDAGYVIAGHTGGDSDAAAHDVWIIRTDGNGDEEWSMIHPGDGDNRAYDVKGISDGNFVLCGYDHEGYGHGREDVFLLKISNDGQIIWEREFGGDSDDRAFAVIQMDDGGFGICGETYSFGEGASDLYVIETSDYGAFRRELTFGGDHFDGGRSLIQASDGDLLALGTTMSSGAGLIDVYLVNIEPQDGINFPVSEELHCDLIHMPNPCSGNVRISFSVPYAGDIRLAIYDSRGNLVSTLERCRLPAGNHSFLWNTTALGAGIPSGVYWSVLQLNGTSIAAQELLFIH